MDDLMTYNDPISLKNIGINGNMRISFSALLPQACNAYVFEEDNKTIKCFM